MSASQRRKKRDKAKQALPHPSKQRPKHKRQAPSATENSVSPGALLEPEEEPVAVADGHITRKKRRKKTPANLTDSPSVAAERSYKTVINCSSSSPVDVPARISRRKSSTGNPVFIPPHTPVSPTLATPRDGPRAHNTRLSPLTSKNPASNW